MNHVSLLQRLVSSRNIENQGDVLFQLFFCTIAPLEIDQHFLRISISEELEEKMKNILSFLTNFFQGNASMNLAEFIVTPMRTQFPPRTLFSGFNEKQEVYGITFELFAEDTVIETILEVFPSALKSTFPDIHCFVKRGPGSWQLYEGGGLAVTDPSTPHP